MKAALRDLRFAATGESPPAAKLLRLWRDLACSAACARRQPRSPPRRPCSTFPRPTPTSSRKARANRAGRGTGFSRREGRGGCLLPPFRTPQPPRPKSSRFGLFDLVLAVRLRWPRTVPLVATRHSGPQSKIGRGRAASAAWRPSLAEGGRSGARPGRRFRPRSCRRPLAPL